MNINDLSSRRLGGILASVSYAPNKLTKTSPGVEVVCEMFKSPPALPDNLNVV